MRTPDEIAEDFRDLFAEAHAALEANTTLSTTSKARAKVLLGGAHELMDRLGSRLCDEGEVSTQSTGGPKP